MRDGYISYRLIPDIKIKNDQNVAIAQAMASCFLDRFNRLSLKGIKEVTKFYFDIELSQNESKFYLTIPQNVEDLVLNKMKTVWDKANIHRESIESPFVVSNTEFGELVLRDYNFKSLDTSKGDLYPLTNVMSLVKTLRQNERVRISICFEPMKRTDWIAVASVEN